MRTPSEVAAEPHAPGNVASKSGTLLSVIVPVYNEAATFRHVLKRIEDVPILKEIIIIDDCSTDGTREVLKKLEAEKAAALPSHVASVRVLFHEVNQGKGAALRTGIAQSKGDIVLIQDADMEYNPSEYPRLLEPILSGDADVVFGSRFKGERARALLFWHRVGNAFLTLLSNMCTNMDVTDMETCYKVFKGDIIRGIPLRSNRFGFEPEITAKVAKLGCAVYEVPISYQGRTYAEGKKINWKDGVSALWTILKFWLVDDLWTEEHSLEGYRIIQGASEYNRWLFNQCKGFIGERVVELGATVGNITKFLLGKERVVATDSIGYYVEDLRRRFRHYSNVEVQKLDIGNEADARVLDRQAKVDTVLAINVLERVKDEEAALKNMNRLLPTGGRLILVAPSHPALHCEMDKSIGILRRYDMRELKGRIESNGFEIEENRYLNWIGALGWFVNGKILKRKSVSSRQVRLFRFFLGLLNVGRWLSSKFGLSLLIVARKVSDVA